MRVRCMPHVLYDCSDYEWDYEKDDDGNYQAQDEFHAKQRQLQEEYEMKQSEQQEANWQKEQENYQKVEDNRMFKAKLMMPLYIKKITKVGTPFLRDCWSYAGGNS